MANAYPAARGLAAKYCPGGQLVNISASPSTAYAPVPSQGIIVDAFCTISAAVTVANAVITVATIKGGTSATIGTITVTTAGSAAGSTYTVVLMGTELQRSVGRGDTVSFASDGGSTTTSIGTFLYVLQET